MVDREYPFFEVEQNVSYDGGWKRLSIEQSYCGGRSPRGLSVYELVLGINRKMFHNKTVLDLGAGKEIQLAKEVAEAGIKTNLIEMSPDYVYENISQMARAAVREPKLVIGLGQQLPFRDDVFDLVLVMHVLEHVDSVRSFFKILSEGARVIKKSGGKAYFAPIRDYMIDAMDYMEADVQTITDRGIEIAIENVPMEYMCARVYDPGTGWGIGHKPYQRLVFTKTI
jgi:2-polyprenyl-3-methyl-5-hydroxy-6-metoxy-1,4-benzoquinol methylase